MESLIFYHSLAYTFALSNIIYYFIEDNPLVMESIYSLSESVVTNIGSPPNELALSSLINFRLPCLYTNYYYLPPP